MPKETVQNMPRAHRTNGKQLYDLAVSIYGHPIAVLYYYDPHPTTQKVGWHLITAGNTTFLGKNWVQAQDNLQNRMEVIKQ